MGRFFTWLREHQKDVSSVLFLTAGLYGVMSVTLFPPQFGPPVEMAILAENLAAHGSFSNPFFVLATGPTAAIPPLYPFMLAVLMKLLRNPNLVYIAAVVGCILANAVTAILLPRLSSVFYGDIIPGVLASVFWISAMPIIPSYDVSYTVLGILAFCLVTSASVTKQEHALKEAVVGGVLAGLIILLNPATLFILVPWMVYVSWQANASVKVRITSCCIVLSILALFIGGWGMRNYYRLGAFAVRTAMGMSLYASNNDCVEADQFRNQLYGCYDAHHPNTSLQEAQLLRNMGEIQYDRKRIGDVEQWAYRNPRRFAILTLKRIANFWFPRTLPSAAEILKNGGPVIPEQVRGWITDRNGTAYAIRIVTALSIPGLIVMLRKRKPVTVYIIVVMAVYPLMYYIIVSDMRYRFPILWLSLLPAGYCVWQLLLLRRPPYDPR